MVYVRPEQNIVVEFLTSGTVRLSIQSGGGVYSRTVRPEEYVTASEGAAILGVTRNALYAAMDDGRLPYAEAGEENYVIRLADLLLFGQARGHLDRFGRR